jgi:predicted nucleic acid-binding protein
VCGRLRRPRRLRKASASSLWNRRYVIQNIEDLPIGKRRAALDKWFEDGLPAWFDSHLLPVTKAIADRWGHLSIEAKKNGLSMTIADGLIAATAMEHDLVIVTRNDVPSSLWV